MSAIRAGYRRSEAGIVPDDWEVKPLRLLAEKIMVGIASAATHAYRDRGIVMFRNQNIKPGYLDDSDLLYIAEDYEATFRNKRLKGGDLLTARTGYPGTTSIVPPQYEGAQSFTTLITRPRPGLVDSEYLCAFINSEEGQRFFEQNQIGGGQKNVNAGSLKNLPVAFPPTTGEQEAIAEALSDTDAFIESLEQLLTKKRLIKQGAMQELLTGKKRLPGFSGEWGVKRLISLVSIAQGQVDPKDSPYCLMVLIGPEHVESGTGKLLARRTALEQGAISGKYLFKAGDVVYGKINPYLRKAFLADFDGLCSADMYPLRPVEGVAPGFLLAIILGSEFSRYSESVSARSGMPKINRDELAGFTLKVPLAFDEQDAIASVLLDMDAEIADLEFQLAKSRAIKQGMMQKLLTGEVRLVPANVGHPN